MITIALNILLIKSKSKQLKTLGKLSIVPSIFNINEPIIFGVPLVFNAILAILYTSSNGKWNINIYFNVY